MNKEIKNKKDAPPENIPKLPGQDEEANESLVNPEKIQQPEKDKLDRKGEAETVSPLGEEDEAEIIFPKDKTEPMRHAPQTKRTLLKFLALALLLIGVYLLGYVTNPEKFDETVSNIKEIYFLAIKEVGPLEKKITEFIETKIKNKPAPNSTGHKTAGEETPLTSGKKIKYWQAPMNPSFIRDEPGKSPMGMDLIPVYEDQGKDGEQVIRINPTITQNIGVKTETVKIRTLTRTIRTIGRLTYDERKVMHVHTKYEGWIEKMQVDYTGKEVKKGELLMEIYSPEMVSTQEEFLLALKYSESFKDNPFPEITLGADRLLNSTRRKLELLDVSKQQIDALIRDRKISKTMQVLSPVDGFVINKPAVHGMRVVPGKSLYTIADLSNIWVLADIYEYELPWVKIGQPVKMELPYYPGKEFSGKVTHIDPYLESKTRTIKIRMEFDNKNGELKPEMYSNITLESIIDKKAVAVPEEAVIHSGKRDIVVLLTKSGGFQSREVTLGAAADGYYQVLKGLEEGEEVVVSSNFLLDSESRLREGIKKLEEKTPEPMPGMKLKMDATSTNGRKTIILKEDIPSP